MHLRRRNYIRGYSLRVWTHTRKASVLSLGATTQHAEDRVHIYHRNKTSGLTLGPIAMTDQTSLSFAISRVRLVTFKQLASAYFLSWRNLLVSLSHVETLQQTDGTMLSLESADVP